jgi:hypothetical protein
MFDLVALLPLTLFTSQIMTYVLEKFVLFGISQLMDRERQVPSQDQRPKSDLLNINLVDQLPAGLQNLTQMGKPALKILVGLCLIAYFSTALYKSWKLWHLKQKSVI